MPSVSVPSEPGGTGQNLGGGAACGWLEGFGAPAILSGTKRGDLNLKLTWIEHVLVADVPGFGSEPLRYKRG